MLGEVHTQPRPPQGPGSPSRALLEQWPLWQTVWVQLGLSVGSGSHWEGVSGAGDPAWGPTPWAPAAPGGLASLTLQPPAPPSLPLALPGSLAGAPTSQGAGACWCQVWAGDKRQAVEGASGTPLGEGCPLPTVPVVGSPESGGPERRTRSAMIKELESSCAKGWVPALTVALARARRLGSAPLVCGDGQL